MRYGLIARLSDERRARIREILAAGKMLANPLAYALSQEEWQEIMRGRSLEAGMAEKLGVSIEDVRSFYDEWEQGRTYGDNGELHQVLNGVVDDGRHSAAAVPAGAEDGE